MNPVTEGMIATYLRSILLILLVGATVWSVEPPELVAQTNADIGTDGKVARTSKPQRGKQKPATKHKKPKKPSKQKKTNAKKPGRKTTPTPHADTPKSTPTQTPAECEAATVACFKQIRETHAWGNALGDAYNLKDDIAAVVASIPKDCLQFLFATGAGGENKFIWTPIPNQDIPEELRKLCEQEIARADIEINELKEESGVFQTLIELADSLAPPDGPLPTEEESKAILQKIEAELTALGIPLADWAAYQKAILKCETNFSECMKSKVEL